ncbi:hypothetical protein [Hymenobacter sp. BT730]|uniref:hypothetical protein n=1 Tax=Hymenobacter sp. BT730 TaxID=3063332 RepID=UPI0026E08774|nr:hypothetical protein [Hymenobacter sp. BT730]
MIQMKHTLRLFIALLLVGSFSACKKDNDDDKPKSKTELLTAKNWRMSAETYSYVDGGRTVTEDAYVDYEPCAKDDFEKYNTDKTLVYDQGPTKCDDTASDPQTQQVNWDFNSDQSKLILSDPGSALSLSFDIVELTASTLKLQFKGSSNGINFTYAATYNAF